MNLNGRRVVLGVSGGIAAYKSCILARRLTESGALQIVGIVEPQLLEWNAACMVGVTVHAGQIDAVARQLAQFPEVSYLAMVTGDFDLVVDVMCRDRDHLTGVITRMRAIPGVTGIKTEIILRIYKMAQADLALVDPRYDEADSD